MAQDRELTPEPFLHGNLITLCRPDLERDVLNGHWHSWFNDLKTTEYLEHGVRPISPEQEEAIVCADLGNPSSFLLTIVSNKDRQVKGVISLKSINPTLRRAEIALVTSDLREPGAALEAMALMTTHGFDRFNLDKIYAGQHQGLWKWVNALALIGYKIEGLRRAHGFRNGSSYDSVLTGITSTDFRNLRTARGGNLLGNDLPFLLKQRSNENMVDRVRELLATLNVGYADC